MTQERLGLEEDARFRAPQPDRIVDTDPRWAQLMSDRQSRLESNADSEWLTSYPQTHLIQNVKGFQIRNHLEANVKDFTIELTDFLGYPLEKKVRVSSLPGNRVHPTLKDKSGNPVLRVHQGVDFAASAGNKVLAATDGTVHIHGLPNSSGYGNYAVIDNGDGIQTLYAHLIDSQRAFRTVTRFLGASS